MSKEQAQKDFDKAVRLLGGQRFIDTMWADAVHATALIEWADALLLRGGIVAPKKRLQRPRIEDWELDDDTEEQ